MGTKERRLREKKQRKLHILNAANELFRKQGYDTTTMPQIAEKTELALGTLYLYFPSKDALYTALLLEGYEAMLKALRAARASVSRKAPRIQFEALLDSFFEFARAYPEYFEIIFFILQKEGQRQDFLTQKELQELWNKEQQCKDIAIDILKQAGHPEQDLNETVNAVWSMIGGVYFYFKGVGTEELHAVAAKAKRIICSALFTKGRAS